MPQALKWHFRQNNKELRHSCTYPAIFIFLGGGGLKFAVNLGIVFRRGRSFCLGLIEIKVRSLNKLPKKNTVNIHKMHFKSIKIFINQ